MMKKAMCYAMALVFVAACGGGGNGGGSPATGTSGRLTHNQLADRFVTSLNAGGEIQVSMSRRSTDQRDFIVVYERQTDQYIAINIDEYTPDQDATAYFQANRSRFFYDLDVIPGYSYYETEYFYYCDCYQQSLVSVPTKYRDRRSGFVFEKIQESPKDLEKMAAMKEAAEVSQAAETLQVDFGLSAERSQEIAQLTKEWQKAGGKNLSVAEQDAFAAEVLGFTISDAMASFKGESSVTLDELIEKAALTNGTSPEHMKEIVSKFAQ